MKSKVILLSSMVILSSISFGLLSCTSNSASSNLIDNGGNGISRKLTVNKNNRKIGLRNFSTDPYEQDYHSVAYQIPDNQSYGLITTTQSQYDVKKEDLDAVFILWCSLGGEAFYINDACYSKSTVTLIEDEKNNLKFVEYNHLTRIDFTLDRGNRGEDRVLNLSSDIGSIQLAEMSVEKNYEKYRWTPNNEEGYISNQKITFTPVYEEPEVISDYKALWVREITFYYES